MKLILSVLVLLAASAGFASENSDEYEDTAYLNVPTYKYETVVTKAQIEQYEKECLALVWKEMRRLESAGFHILRVSKECDVSNQYRKGEFTGLYVVSGEVNFIVK